MNSWNVHCLQMATVIVASTQTLQYPSYMNNDFVGVIASLIPTPQCHFLMTRWADLYLEYILVKCKKRQSWMSWDDFHNQRTEWCRQWGPWSYVSILNIIQGDVDPTDVGNIYLWSISCFNFQPPGAPIITKNTWVPSCKLHPMGACIYPSCPDLEITLYYCNTSCQWPYACESHMHSFCKCLLSIQREWHRHLITSYNLDV